MCVCVYCRAGVSVGVGTVSIGKSMDVVGLVE